MPPPERVFFYFIHPRQPRSTLFPYTTLFRSFRSLGFALTIIGNQPDGRNINLNCGSTHPEALGRTVDRKSTRLNSSHSQISYAVFCLKKKRTAGNVRQCGT